MSQRGSKNNPGEGQKLQLVGAPPALCTLWSPCTRAEMWLCPHHLFLPAQGEASTWFPSAPQLSWLCPPGAVGQQKAVGCDWSPLWGWTQPWAVSGGWDFTVQKLLEGPLSWRGHPTWTCPRLLCAHRMAPAVPLSPSAPSTDFTSPPPHRPRPLTLSISLFFSSPFASFSCWLWRFQASGPWRLCTLLSAPDFHSLLAAARTHPRMLSTTRHRRDGGQRDCHGAWRSSAASCCSPQPPPSLLGCRALQPKIPSMPPQSPSATPEPQPPQPAEGLSASLSHHLPLGRVDLGQLRGTRAAHAAWNRVGNFSSSSCLLLMGLFLAFPSSSSPPS